MAARGLLLADPVSPALLRQRRGATEAVPHTQQRHPLLALEKGRRCRSCITYAVAEAPPAQAPEALQLEVCFEAPPENFVPPTRIQTKGRIVASAFPRSALYLETYLHLAVALPLRSTLPCAQRFSSN